MINAIWIARDQARDDEPIGDVILYGHEPVRNEEKGLFESVCPASGESAFLECSEFTEMIILNPDAFPMVTWENSPQRLTLTKETDCLELANI